MSTLRGLFPADVSGVLTEVRVWATNTNDTSNGGRCCQWTAPTGVSWALFEVWGGGGSGGGACCCMGSGRSGGSGSYARRIITVCQGWQYTVCAGGTGCCISSSEGMCGYPSFVCGCNLTLCAAGGAYGGTCCNPWQSAFIGCANCYCGGYAGVGDGFGFGLCGAFGGGKMGVMCATDAWVWIPGGTQTANSGMRMSKDGCSQGASAQYGCGGAGLSTFPGGGGGNAFTHGGCCMCGQFGAGGLVTITYR